MSKKLRQQIQATLPCCSSTVKVTGRKSKQMERGRFHSCTGCGRLYEVYVANGKVANCKNVG